MDDSFNGPAVRAVEAPAGRMVSVHGCARGRALACRGFLQRLESWASCSRCSCCRSLIQKRFSSAQQARTVLAF